MATVTVNDLMPALHLLLKPAQLAAAAYVANDAPNLWGWVIFPRGFRAPALLKFISLQARTPSRNASAPTATGCPGWCSWRKISTSGCTS